MPDQPSPPSPERLQQLLEAWKAGDRGARDELLRFAMERFKRLTHKMLKDFPQVHRWEGTDDVMQNALVRLWRALAEVRPESVTHFFRLAALQIRRELLDLHKHWFGPLGAGAKHATNAGQESGSTPWYDGHAVAKQPAPGAWVTLHECVDELPEPQREVVERLIYFGYKQVEVAVQLGVTVRTVQNRYDAALLKLHDALGGEEGVVEW